MLWDAINKVEFRLRSDAKKTTSYQGRVATLKKSIAKIAARIGQVKQENLGLQHMVNNLLLVKLNEF